MSLLAYCSRPATGRLAILVSALTLAEVGSAAVVELERAGFDAAIAGSTAYIEDFQGLPIGATGTPLILSNGLVFNNAEPFITTNFLSTSQILIGNSLPLTGARLFTGFSADATLVGFDVLVHEDDGFNVTVTTTSGYSLIVAARRGKDFEGFFGIQVTKDSIASIAFAGIGGSPGPGSDGSGITNYGFDNITVDARTPVPVPVPVPLPPAIALASMLWFVRRRS